MNNCSIVGNLCSDPVHRTTQTGVSVCSFTVAVNRRGAKDGQPQADFFRVTTWRGLADNCAKWLVKGKKAVVTGSISASAYMGNDGKPHASLDLNADDVEFISQANTIEQPKVHSTPPTPKVDKQTGFVEVGEEDLPF